MVFQSVIHRLPKLQSLLSVFAVIMFMVYTWTFYVFIRSLPYWLRFLNLSEIFAIFSYAVLVDFLESFAFISLLVLLSILLPSGVLSNAFAIKGTVIAIFLLGAVFAYLNYHAPGSLRLPQLLAGSTVVSLGIFLFSFFSPRIRPIALFTTWLSGNIMIFLYVYIPITALALLVVCVRNL